jgi:hypothetical protein
LLSRRWNRRSGRREHRAKVDFERLQKLAGSDVFAGFCRSSDADIVHNYLEPAEFLNRCLDECLSGFWVAGVPDERYQVTVVLCNDICGVRQCALI